MQQQQRGAGLMVWFRVDDGWHKHRKRIRTGLDLEGMAAQGLWAAAGSWCGDELSDGFIPDDVVDYLAPGVGQMLAKRLESARLWVRDERDGESGWAFHQWVEQQPTREEVEAVTSKKSSGGKLGNHRRWHADSGKLDPTCPFCHEDDAPARQYRSSNRGADRSTDRRSDQTSESGANPPTRTDPNRPEPSDPPSVDLFGATAPPTERVTKEPAKKAPKTPHRLPEDFSVGADLANWAREKAPAVDWPSETERFKDYWDAATKNDLKRNWDAAWRTWMRTAQERLVDRGITRRWSPGTNNQGRAGSELARREAEQGRPRSPADQRVADNQALYEHYKRIEDEEKARG
jgi:hypothetical protein